MSKPTKRALGRPIKPAEQRMKRVNISVPPDLHEAYKLALAGKPVSQAIADMMQQTVSRK